jgi:hypothetical protein
MIDITRCLQNTPGGKCEQSRHDKSNQKIAEWLSQQGFQTLVAVLRFSRILGCQQRKDTDDQIKHSSGGIASPSEEDKVALRGHGGIPERL